MPFTANCYLQRSLSTNRHPSRPSPIHSFVSRRFPLTLKVSSTCRSRHPGIGVCRGPDSPCVPAPACSSRADVHRRRWVRTAIGATVRRCAHPTPTAPSTHRTGWSARSTTSRRRPASRCCGPGGTAADAAVATSAVLAVTTQHMCGMGGDLFALVHHGGSSAGRVGRGRPAGSGADAAAMRAEGLTAMPMRGDVRSATVPGCVDGWLALHERFGRLPLAQVLAPARDYAANGFPASPLLALGSRRDRCGWPAPTTTCRAGGLRTGDRVRRPLVARRLDAIVRDGRAGFYGGGVRRRPARARRRAVHADGSRAVARAAGTDPLRVTAWDREIWTVPPPSQGYLTLAGARIADGLDLPDDPDDPSWAAPAVRGRQMGRPRPGLRCCSTAPTGADLLADDRLATRRAGDRPAAPHRTRPSPPRAAAPSTCAWWTTTGWVSR